MPFSQKGRILSNVRNSDSVLDSGLLHLQPSLQIASAARVSNRDDSKNASEEISFKVAAPDPFTDLGFSLSDGIGS